MLPVDDLLRFDVVQRFGCHADHQAAGVVRNELGVREDPVALAHLAVDIVFGVHLVSCLQM